MHKLPVLALLALAPLVVGAPGRAAAVVSVQDVKMTLETPTLYTGDGITEVKALGPGWAKKFQPYCDTSLAITGQFPMDLIAKGQLSFSMVRGTTVLPVNHLRMAPDMQRIHHPEAPGVTPWAAPDVKPPYVVTFVVQFPAEGMAKDDFDGWAMAVALDYQGKRITTVQAPLIPQVYPEGKRPPLSWD